MANIGQTLFRFAGAMLLAAGAAAIDRPNATRRAAEESVVIAAKDIPQGTVIERSAVLVTPWPAHLVPSGAFSVIDSVVGRVAGATTFQGEPVVFGRLVPRARAEVDIAPGKRGYGIRVINAPEMVRLIEPGSRVDLVVILRPNADRPQRIAKILMSDIRVLAAGAVPRSGTQVERDQAMVATLEVTPLEAERIAIAGTQGVFSLVLRPNGERSGVTVGSAVRVP